MSKVRRFNFFTKKKHFFIFINLEKPFVYVGERVINVCQVYEKSVVRSINCKIRIKNCEVNIVIWILKCHWPPPEKNRSRSMISQSNSTLKFNFFWSTAVDSNIFKTRLSVYYQPQFYQHHFKFIVICIKCEIRDMIDRFVYFQRKKKQNTFDVLPFLNIVPHNHVWSHVHCTNDSVIITLALIHIYAVLYLSN